MFFSCYLLIHGPKTESVLFSKSSSSAPYSLRLLCPSLYLVFLPSFAPSLPHLVTLPSGQALHLVTLTVLMVPSLSDRWTFISQRRLWRGPLWTNSALELMSSPCPRKITGP
jgi:hypothetical protein